MRRATSRAARRGRFAPDHHPIDDVGEDGLDFTKAGHARSPRGAPVGDQSQEVALDPRRVARGELRLHLGDRGEFESRGHAVALRVGAREGGRQLHGELAMGGVPRDSPPRREERRGRAHARGMRHSHHA